MIATCPSYLDAGFVEGVLATVDCQGRSYAQGGYEALTQGSGLFGVALTALMTVYIALIGWRLLLAPDGAKLSEAPAAALRIGVILALVTNWSTFQTLVFDVADRAPAQIAAVVSAPWTGSADGIAGAASRPLARIDAAYTEMRSAAAAFGRTAAPGAKGWMSAEAASGEALALAANSMLVMSIGVIGGAKLVIAVLTAVGPIFIALALLEVTRGIFVGWLRALAGAALTLLVGWILVILLLVVLAPWLTTLADQREAQALDSRTASSLSALVLVFAIGQGLLILAAWVAALGLKLPSASASASAAQAAAPAAAGPGPGGAVTASRADRLAQALTRDETRFESRSRIIERPSQRPVPTAAGYAGPGPRNTIGDSYRRPAAGRRRGGS
jgi:type IV secretion system protein VirB6